MVPIAETLRLESIASYNSCMNEILLAAKMQLEKLLTERYSLKSTIDQYEVKDLTQREKEILEYGFEEGRKTELLVVLYDLLSRDKDGMKYVADRVGQKIFELRVLVEDMDYSDLAQYLKGLREVSN